MAWSPGIGWSCYPACRCRWRPGRSNGVIRDGCELPIGQYNNYQRNGFGGLLNMRFFGLAVIAGVAGLVACAGGDKRADDPAAAVAVDTSTIASASLTTSPETPAVTGTMAPITGTTH